MAPSSKTPSTRTISQQAFDEVVRDNIEELGMDPEEALSDAIETLTLQGVDLSGIVTSGTSKDNPVIQCLDRLKEVKEMEVVDLNEMVRILGNLIGVLSGAEASGFGSIAVKNGGVELVCDVCKKIPSGSDSVAVSGLKALSLLLRDLESTEKFRASGGVEMVVGLLKDGNDKADLLNAGFSVVAMSAAGNEVVKQSFMELKIDQIILDVLNRQGKGSVNSLYDAIRVLLTPDDNRVLASQVYGYARRFAKIGIAGALVDSLHAGLTSLGLVSASIALKAVAVNDEICKSIAERGGIDAILKCIDDSGEQGNSTVARTSCSLLSRLAGSDSNKCSIVEKRGVDRLIQLSARFSDDPSVLQEVMSIISVLCLRNSDNAAHAVEAGAGDLAIQAMQKFPNSLQLQRNTCFMIRNLVVRNPENRTILLNNGIEKLIRRAKQSHESCKDAATDALRDLGVDNYNS